MNCEHAGQLWDRRRDEELPADLRRAFDQHLTQCPPCRTRWRAETSWLEALDDTTAAAAPRASAQAFRTAVLEEWDRRREPPVVARIGWPQAMFRRFTFVAAAAAIVLAVLWWTGPEAHGPTLPPNAVSSLVGSLNENCAQQPLRLFRSVERTASLLDLNRLGDMLKLPVPDPAQYVDPPPSRG